ncbi:DUF2243 domain-containing protein [Bacillus licheniformis]|uniref:DUF2243 domain-containing protein n=1 Tax=Bacillus licheniformis TaxID=1402 RepID=UPI002E1F8D97|nr:DUF2243 domain-containing protein [Bacillus licheniformis]
MKNKKAFWGPFLFGVGIIAMIDGIIFHQLLQWHSVYMDTDRSHQIMSRRTVPSVFARHPFHWRNPAVEQGRTWQQPAAAHLLGSLFAWGGLV